MTTVVLGQTLAVARDHARALGIRPMVVCSLRTLDCVRGLHVSRIVAVGLSPSQVATWLERPEVLPAWVRVDRLTVEYVR